MKKTLFLLASFLLVSCAKEEFAANKASQSSSSSALSTSCGTLYTQSTLVSPKVDILMLWDNSSSALFINSATKSSMSNLITSVSENFDYHILSAPLISSSSDTLSETSLVAKDSASVTGNALNVLKSKDAAVSSLGFSQATGSMEYGVDRASAIIEANRSNGVFRNDAYTIIVVMSNGDDTSCEQSTGYTACAKADWSPQIQTKVNKLLCLRGNSSTAAGCSSTLNSSMMRFINISALTSCSSGLGKVNSRYRQVAKSIYEAPYTNGWPTSNDDLNPFVSGGVQYPDSYDICSIDFNHIFDGVNTAIKQTLLKHVYDFWPLAGTNDSVDPSTIVVTRLPDGKVLTNHTGESNPSDGYSYIGNQTNHSTRSYPTVGENYTGKMIQLFGSTGNDKLQYPQALRICYQDFKSKYGYIYLQNGKPDITTMEVYINGNKIPQNATNGWSYMGLQYTNALDTTNYKIYNYKGDASGYFLQLNGTAQFTNSSNNTVTVYYTSAP